MRVHMGGGGGGGGGGVVGGGGGVCHCGDGVVADHEWATPTISYRPLALTLTNFTCLGSVHGRNGVERSRSRNACMTHR